MRFGHCSLVMLTLLGEHGRISWFLGKKWVLFSSLSFISYAKKFMSAPVSYNPLHLSALFYVLSLETKTLSDQTSGTGYYYIRIQKRHYELISASKNPTQLFKIQHITSVRSTCPVELIFDARMEMTVKRSSWDKLFEPFFESVARLLTILLVRSECKRRK